MTYNDFRRLSSGAIDCKNSDEFILDVGGSLPSKYADHPEMAVKILEWMWEYTHGNKVTTTRKLAGMSQNIFGTNYDIPCNTVKNWEQKNRAATGYKIDYVALAVVTDWEERWFG